MKVEISREKENGTRYKASLVIEQEPPLSQKFDTLRDLIAYIREQRNKARISGEPFELVRKPA